MKCNCTKRSSQSGFISMMIAETPQAGVAPAPCGDPALPLSDCGARETQWPTTRPSVRAVRKKSDSVPNSPGVANTRPEREFLSGYAKLSERESVAAG